MAVESLEKLDPSLALRDGTRDPRIVLGLWCLRKSFFPLIWLGLGVAVIVIGDIQDLESGLPSFDNPGELLSNLLSPFGILVLAIGVRIGSNFLALAAAFPLTLRTRTVDYGTGRKTTLWFRVWWDRVRLASRSPLPSVSGVSIRPRSGGRSTGRPAGRRATDPDRRTTERSDGGAWRRAESPPYPPIGHRRDDELTHLVSITADGLTGSTVPSMPIAEEAR
jgi:hypothetical protein